MWGPSSALRQRAQQLWQQRDVQLLLAALVPVSAFWLFFEIAEEVEEGQTAEFDRAILLAFRDPAQPADALGPPWLEEAMRDLTALGSFSVLGLVTFVTAGYLLLVRRWRALVLLLASSLGGTLLVALLKAGFARPRPDLVPHLTTVYTASFPSGHAALAAVVYLTLAAILAQLAPRRRLKAYLVGAALFVTALVGVTRIYAGVHYPSDVVAGWAMGLSWSTLVWLVTWRLKRRGVVREGAPDEPAM